MSFKFLENYDFSQRLGQNKITMCQVLWQLRPATRPVGGAGRERLKSSALSCDCMIGTSYLSIMFPNYQNLMHYKSRGPRCDSPGGGGDGGGDGGRGGDEASPDAAVATE